MDQHLLRAPIGKAGRAALVTTPVLSGIAIGGLPAIVPQLSEHFATTPGAETMVRALLTSVGAAMIIGAPAAGFLSERFGERRVLMMALATFAVAGTAGGLANDLWVLLITRILVGIAIGASGVVALTLLTASVPNEQRDRWIGYMVVVGSLGSVVLIPLAGLLGSVNWRLAFLLHLLAVPLLMMILMFTRQPQLGPVAAVAAAPHKRFPWALVLLGLGCGATTTTLSVYLPFHLKAIGVTSPSQVAAPLTAAILSGAFVAFGFGALRRHLSAITLLVLAFLFTSVGILILGLGGTYPMAIAGMFVGGFGLGLTTPTLFSIAASGDATHRSRRVGLARAGYFGAPLLAQLPLEPIAINHGAIGALYAIAAFAVVMIAVVLAGRRQFSLA